MVDNQFPEDPFCYADLVCHFLRGTAPTEESEAIKPAAEAFRANVFRTYSLILTTSVLCRSVSLSCNAILYAKIEIAGDPLITDAELEKRDLLDKCKARYSEILQGAIEGHDKSKHLYEGLRQYVHMMKGASAESPPVQALDALFSTVILQTWIAFEVIAADLWVAAIDARPQDFIPRIATGDKATIKSVFGGMTFDPNPTLGQILKQSDQYNWNRLEGIEEGYKALWQPIGEAVFAPHRGGLYAAEAVRNLLVHRSGVVDDKFLERVKARPDAFREFCDTSSVKRGDMLRLDGRCVVALTTPLIETGKTLIKYVDDNLVKKDGKSSE